MSEPTDSETSDDSLEDLRIRTAKALPPLRFKEKHRLLKMRLGPLYGVQADLEQRLGAGTTELYTTSVTTAAPFDPPAGRRALQEFSINSSNGWKSALDKFRTLRAGRPEATPGSQRKGKNVEGDLSEIISSCRDDMKALWEDPVIGEMLNRRKVRIEDAPGL